jgi:predicted transcriptional regulator with HTH domain
VTEELTAVQTLALLALAEATVERGGVIVDSQPDRELWWRSLIRAGLAEVYSPRQALLGAGLFSRAEDAGPDLYRVTETGGRRAIKIIADHQASRPRP